MMCAMLVLRGLSSQSRVVSSEQSLLKLHILLIPVLHVLPENHGNLGGAGEHKTIVLMGEEGGLECAMGDQVPKRGPPRPNNPGVPVVCAVSDLDDV